MLSNRTAWRADHDLLTSNMLSPEKLSLQSVPLAIPARGRDA